MAQEDLNALVAKIAALEKRLWGGEPPGGGAISEAQLLQFLTQAGQRFFSRHEEDGESGEPPLELTEAVNEVVEEYSQEKGRPSLLSIKHAALVQLVENLFRSLEYSHDLDAEVFAVLRGLQICMVRMAVVDVATLASPTRPLRQFMEQALLACQGCDQHAGFRSQVLLTRIKQAVQEIIDTPLSPELACYAARDEFAAFLPQYERESQAVEEGILEKDQTLVLQERWQQTVKAEAFGVLAGKRLPKAALEFFDQIWSEYLLGFTQWEGADGKAWDQGVEAVHSLVGSLSIRDPEQMLTCYSGMLIEVLDVFRKGAEKIRGDSALTHRFLRQMEDFCLQVLDGKEPDPSQMIDVPPNAYDLDYVEVTDATQLALIDSMEEGAWYLLQGRGIEKRGKLIQKNRQDQYCLFVNYSGIKTERLDFYQVVEGLESGTIKAVEMGTVYQRALQYASEQMQEFIPHLQTKAEEAEAERQLLEAKIEKARQAELLLELQEKRRREAEVARKKARRVAAKRAKQKASQRAEAALQARQRALELARSDVEQMQAGGRLELIGDGQAKIVCELGVRLKSSQKLIFVDQFGRKQLEFMPEDLAQRIAAGDGRILDFGATFDDTLRNLIVEHSSKIPVQ